MTENNQNTAAISLLKFEFGKLLLKKILKSVFQNALQRLNHFTIKK